MKAVSFCFAAEKICEKILSSTVKAFRVLQKGRWSNMKTILKTQNSKDRLTQYNLVRSEIQLDNKVVFTYGIEVESVNSEEKQKSAVLDITTNCERAEKLFDKIIRLEITPSSLKDIVDDFIIS